MVRYRLNHAKVIDAIDLIARSIPNITQYYIGKILFFADREHLLDYGRPITGDKYVAMEHGPVPSAIRNWLGRDSDYPDELIQLMYSQIEITYKDNLQHVVSNMTSSLPNLSGSDAEYIRESVNKYGHMAFGELREISHNDVAYSNAWKKAGNANELDFLQWFEKFEDPQLAMKQVEEYAIYGN
ncbi:MAG: SocA family protein [Rhodobacteraceae bacterium]|nr:SocA family protein [Paracoccaceae bacterium]